MNLFLPQADTFKKWPLQFCQLLLLVANAV